jgi:hypothetical protein
MQKKTSPMVWVLLVIVVLLIIVGIAYSMKKSRLQASKEPFRKDVEKDMSDAIEYFASIPIPATPAGKQPIDFTPEPVTTSAPGSYIDVSVINGFAGWAKQGVGNDFVMLFMQRSKKGDPVVGGIQKLTVGNTLGIPTQISGFPSVVAVRPTNFDTFKAGVVKNFVDYWMYEWEQGNMFKDANFVKKYA